MSAAPSSKSDLVVDLGYQLNRGRAISERLVTFRNIRYAAPPIGSLRFSAPQAPATDRSTIQDHEDVIPPQAYPHWLTAGNTDLVGPEDLPPVDPRTSEDCLFLDVLLPKAIWEDKENARAPVIVWISGGGFAVGWKDASGRGEGLVTRSHENGETGGWLHGDGVTSNAGLLDQKLAFEWVQKYIHLFGGDSNRVTILGESAGGSSVAAHITAYGGAEGSLPFAQAIAQSPYHVPASPTANSSLETVLEYAGIDSLESLRRLPTEKLQELNALIISNATPFGSFIFSIVVDCDYVPDLSDRLLHNGRFNRNTTVMTGYCKDEGSRFVPKNITRDKIYEEFLKATLPPLKDSPEELKVITKELYPPIFDGSQGYNDQTERTSLTIADASFVCHTRALNAADFKHPGYAYEFTAPNGLHAADLPYTFFDFEPVEGVDAEVAKSLQKYIANFAQCGDPNGPGLAHFPTSQAGTRILEIGTQGFKPLPYDETNRRRNERCRFWQQAAYVKKHSG